MKKINYFILALSLLVGSCKKEKKEAPVPASSGGGTTVNTTPAYVSPQPGSLKINISSLTLHPGSSGSFVATVYNPDGTVSTSSSALTWQSSDPLVATVSNGLVTAVDTGYTTVTVTDGVHGVMGMGVRIVGPNIPISTAPTTIAFNNVAGVMGNSAIALTPNSTSTINYTLYDAQGNVAAGSPVFYATTAAPFTISGSTISSSSTTGMWDVKAKIGGNDLLGKLRVIVFQSDTTTYINSTLGTFPVHFCKPHLTASRPLLVCYNQIWYSLIDGFHWKTTTVSPDYISSNFPGVASLNSSGFLTSNAAGRTRVTIKYKGDSLSYFTTVTPFLAGNWGGNASNYNLNFCFDEIVHDVIYSDDCRAYDGDNFYPNIVYGTQWIKKNGVVVTDPVVGENTCFFIYNIDWSFEGLMTDNEIGRFYCFLLPSHLGSDDFYASWNGSTVTILDPSGAGNTKYPLTRGAGNCTGANLDSSFASWYFNGTLKQGFGQSDIHADADSNDCGVHWKKFTLFSDFTNGIVVCFGAQISGLGTYPLIDSLVCLQGSTTITTFPSFYSDTTCWGSSYRCTSGTLNINEYNSNYIGGTFNFNGPAPCGGSFNVTGGKFKVRR